MKKIRILIVLCVLLFSLAGTALAQSSLLWSMECDGQIEVSDIGEYPYPSYLVNCYGEPPTPTLAPTLTPTPTPTLTPTPVIGYPPSAPDHLIDAEDIADFPVPLDGLRRGADVRMFFDHKSVGQMINWGMGCLATAPGYNITATTGEVVCRQYLNQGYSNHWTGVGFSASDWKGKLVEFEADVNAGLDQYDAFGFKYCYLNGINSNPSYWADFDQVRDMYLRLAEAHLEKQFVLWTMPLYSSYYPGIETYNAAVRQWWAAGNIPTNIWLFDLASIESTRPDGSACSVGGHEVLCSNYLPASGVGGHPTKVGGERIARYIWVMLSRMNIAGQ